MSKRVCAWLVVSCVAASAVSALEVAVSVDPGVADGPLDGRVLLLLAVDGEEEPRYQIGWGLGGGQVFGVDVEELAPGEAAVFTAETFGWPTRSLGELPAGEYHVEGLLHRYATFHRADAHAR